MIGNISIVFWHSAVEQNIFFIYNHIQISVYTAFILFLIDIHDIITVQQTCSLITFNKYFFCRSAYKYPNAY
jgi:hypothetical protein